MCEITKHQRLLAVVLLPPAEIHHVIKNSQSEPGRRSYHCPSCSCMHYSPLWSLLCATSFPTAERMCRLVSMGHRWCRINRFPVTGSCFFPISTAAANQQSISVEALVSRQTVRESNGWRNSTVFYISLPILFITCFITPSHISHDSLSTSGVHSAARLIDVNLGDRERLNLAW